jgi:hypothetical protein
MICSNMPQNSGDMSSSTLSGFEASGGVELGTALTNVTRAGWGNSRIGARAVQSPAIVSPRKPTQGVNDPALGMSRASSPRRESATTAVGQEKAVVEEEVMTMSNKGLPGEGSCISGLASESWFQCQIKGREGMNRILKAARKPCGTNACWKLRRDRASATAPTMMGSIAYDFIGGVVFKH